MVYALKVFTIFFKTILEASFLISLFTLKFFCSDKFLDPKVQKVSAGRTGSLELSVASAAAAPAEETAVFILT